MLLHLAKKQAEHRDWAAWNFPHSTMVHPALGLGEEMISEFAAALENNDEDAMRDALADGTIYLIDLANKLGISLDTELAGCELTRDKMPEPTEDDIFRDIILKITDLQGCVLKISQGIRPEREERAIRNVKNLLALFIVAAEVFFDSNIEDIYNEAWAKVQKRDWKRFPKNGVSE